MPAVGNVFGQRYLYLTCGKALAFFLQQSGFCGGYFTPNNEPQTNKKNRFFALCKGKHIDWLWNGFRKENNLSIFSKIASKAMDLANAINGGLDDGGCNKKGFQESISVFDALIS